VLKTRIDFSTAVTGRVRASFERIERISEIVVDVREFAHVCGAGQGGSDPKAAVAVELPRAPLESDEVA